MSTYYSSFLAIFPPVVCLASGHYVTIDSAYQVLGFVACGAVAFIQQYVLFRSVQIEHFSKTSIMFYLLILNGCLLDILMIGRPVEPNV